MAIARKKTDNEAAARVGFEQKLWAAAAALLSPAAYERSEQERQMLRALARGERDIRKTRGVDLDQVLAEADDVLEGES